MKKKPDLKTPPRGGDAAAAWEHHLKPDEKEELARQYREAGEQKLVQGKRAVLIIAAVNAAAAIVSAFTGANLISVCIQLAICIALFLGAPGIRLIFPAGAVIAAVMISGAWRNPGDSETFRTVLSIVQSACLTVSSVFLIMNENISEYLYAKRHG